MAYYVVGGEYRDTTFREIARPDATEGPCDRYEDALARWRTKSIRHVDEAFVRYKIVRAPADVQLNGRPAAASV